MAHQSKASEGLQQCIDACTECGQVCTETVAYCLEQGGEHASRDHVRLLLDCAEICQTSANYMSRRSDLHAETCAVCADVCERCASQCESFDDEQMRHCAEVCQRCAESCRQMAGGTRVAHAA